MARSLFISARLFLARSSLLPLKCLSLSPPEDFLVNFVRKEDSSSSVLLFCLPVRHLYQCLPRRVSPPFFSRTLFILHAQEAYGAIILRIGSFREAPATQKSSSYAYHDTSSRPVQSFASQQDVGRRAAQLRSGSTTARTASCGVMPVCRRQVGECSEIANVKIAALERPTRWCRIWRNMSVADILVTGDIPYAMKAIPDVPVPSPPRTYTEVSPAQRQ